MPHAKRTPAPLKITLSRDTAAQRAVQEHPGPITLEVEREDLLHALALLEAGTGGPLRLLDAGRLALEFWANAFGDARPELRAVADAFGQAVGRYRTKEAPDLDRAFRMPEPAGKRRRQAWHDRLVEFRGAPWNAGSAAWALYVEALRSGRTETAAVAEIAAALGIQKAAARRYVRELRADLSELLPEETPRPAYPGRPKKLLPRDS